jgi:DNA-binding transcriptional LysR family regulator
MNVLYRIKPAHLRLIVKISETGKVHVAANLLGMSQPAASRILSEIETNLGTDLFERHPKGVELTAVGHTFIRHASVILSQMEMLEREIRHLKVGSMGELSIGSVTGAAIGYLMPAINELLENHQKIDIKVEVGTSNELIRGLDEGKFDFILARLPSGHDIRKYISYPARVEKVNLIVHSTHPLAKKSAVSLEELYEYPWVVQERGNPIRQAIDNAFANQGLTLPGKILSSSSLLVALSQVSSSQTIAPQTREVFELLSGSELAANLKTLNVMPEIVVPPYFVILDQYRRQSKVAELLLNYILEKF